MGDGSAPLVAFATAGLPTTNRGVSDSGSTDQPRRVTSVDWMAASIDLVALLDQHGMLPTWEILGDLNGFGGDAINVAAAIHATFFAGTGVRLDNEKRKGSFYKWRFHLLDASNAKVGQIEMGGAHTMRKDGTPTARIELTGNGCRAYEGNAHSDHAKRWLELRAKLASVAGRLSRCDLAFDDLDGTYNLAFCVRLFLAGKFNARGQEPAMNEHRHYQQRKGDTVNIGSPTSERFMRVYEKGKEQGDEKSVWVRWEIQFRASSRRELDLDMLTSPADFMRGAYEALDFICDTARRLDVTKEQMAATLISATKHLRRQYGATLNFFATILPDANALGEFMVNLVGPRLPEWAHQHLGPHGYVPLLDAIRIDPAHATSNT